MRLLCRNWARIFFEILTSYGFSFYMLSTILLVPFCMLHPKLVLPWFGRVLVALRRTYGRHSAFFLGTAPLLIYRSTHGSLLSLLFYQNGAPRPSRLVSFVGRQSLLKDQGTKIVHCLFLSFPLS